ncbi:PAS domain S-box protein [Hymenobacter sp. J193]|uniref:PAS domain S-box protein n=1 Tax=Hymenobacter sp. J193 TaxID=2898429 RepID=UPI002150B6F4|nr:PAS domain S-box protein [Hymenobacter sp. J193]MCR5889542.1 PAS domain S-box protein [Hymenobacter sp. J193]
MSVSDSVPTNAFFDQHPDAVFTLNTAGELIRANARFAELLGYTPAQFVGTSLFQYLLPSETVRARQCFQQALRGEILTHDVSVRTKEQGIRSLLCTVFPLVEGQEVRGVHGIMKDLAAAERAEKHLRQREQQLSVIFNTMTDVVFVLDVEGEGRYRFSFANNAFAVTTGIPLAQLIGRLAQDVIPEPLRTMELARYAKAIATRQRQTWQETSDFPSGLVTGEVTLTPVVGEDGACTQLVGIVHDLTAQKRIAEALQISNERYEYVFRATNDAIYDWNIPGNTLYWGQSFEALFGHVLEENVSNLDLWAEFIHPEDTARTVNSLLQAVESADVRYWQSEYRFRRADGSWATIFDRGYVLRDAAGRSLRMIGAMQDISERKEAEERQLQMSREVFKQNADLQQFAYIVSHNLRGPLANALGFADLLQRTAKDTEVFDTSLKNLHASIRQLDAVLMEVNTVLSIRDQQEVPRLELVHLAGVCQRVAQSLEEPLRECAGTIVCYIPEDLRVSGNRAYFHSIFYNLFANAIKYRAEGRPLVVEVEGNTSPETGTTITISDNGSGFDTVKAGQEVFQLYKRFHAVGPGRGIGLFLVKSHVESMGGTVAVESQVNVGTRFILRFS